MKFVIFTGAGAGREDGVPLQKELFGSFFRDASTNGNRRELVTRLATLFESTFSIDPRQDHNSQLPTFEEVLGVLDLAISREESLRLDRGTPPSADSIQQKRRDLILALAATLSSPSRSQETHHGTLVKNLRSLEVLEFTAFITTNYDTLLDDAIERFGADDAIRGLGSLVDYGFRNARDVESSPHDHPQRFQCLKIHGSLNWLFCPVCDDLSVTHVDDGVARLVDEPDEARCHSCEAMRSPIIVPPSYFKSLSNLYLATVWARAYQVLLSADLLVFCGYSFPDADIHVKYLIKRAQQNRDPTREPLRISVVAKFTEKPAVQHDAELARFRRFLGPDVVDSGLSFAEFCAQPAQVLR